MLFGDICKRNIKDIPYIDMYECGFPCQPFSVAGKRKGTKDSRGTIFWECLQVIQYKKPMIFILENVRGLLSIDQGKTFQSMMDELNKIKISHVDWKILNTADYGIPQSRKRIYIVGILKKSLKTEFKWPEPIPCKPLECFVDQNDHDETKNYIRVAEMENHLLFLMAFRKKLIKVHHLFQTRLQIVIRKLCMFFFYFCCLNKKKIQFLFGY